KSSVLSFTEKVKTVSIANEDIADVVSITPIELVIIGKKVGVTTLLVWGELGKIGDYELRVNRNVTGQQVVLEVQVAEVNRTRLSEYGVDFLLIDTDDGGVWNGTQILGSYAGEVTSPDPTSRDMMIPDGATAAIKWIDHRQRIYGALKALQRNGALELLANPRLLSLSGEEASFLVGGEIPVPVAQSTSSAGVPNVTIQWKEYGIRLHFLPTIIDTNLVNLKIKPEISSLDWANMVSFGGYDIPALRTRKASATVELNSDQAIVLGGLIATESFKTIKRIPILGHIPILNFFFSRKETSTVETELLIVVSPRIIGSVADESIPPLPTLEKNESTGSATSSPEGDSQTDATHQSDSLAAPADQ
ncbi:MAG: pilus assembly protein N-terminal domain-containing protein, partial [candidate division Zixibacteria bacterium]|nr:pilus assembly protein N-terminal domain-containing protein [candidate division Zixibacteria bacterium]